MRSYSYGWLLRNFCARIIKSTTSPHVPVIYETEASSISLSSLICGFHSGFSCESQEPLNPLNPYKRSTFPSQKTLIYDPHCYSIMFALWGNHGIPYCSVTCLTAYYDFFVVFVVTIHNNHPRYRYSHFLSHILIDLISSFFLHPPQHTTMSSSAA